MQITNELRQQILKFDLELLPGNFSLARSLLYNGPVRIYPGCTMIRARIDAYSYVQTGSSITTTSIGRYCSLASNINTGLGIHRTDWPTTSIALFAKRTFDFHTGPMPYPWKVKENGEETTEVTIGNDVWIGTRVVTAGSKDLHIGDGAVVGACSVVTHDVPPYAIVAGNPARIIRMRFSDAQIDELLQLKWWQYDLPLAIKQGIQVPVTKIDDFIAFMHSADLDALPKIPEKWRFLRPIDGGKMQLIELQPGQTVRF